MCRIRWVVALSCLVVVGACKSGPETAEAEAPAESAESENVAKFRFGWQSDTELVADVRKEYRRPGGESEVFRGGYRLSTERGDEGRRVRVEPEMNPEVTGTDEVTVADGMATATVLALPVIEVGSEGTFESVAELESAREAFRGVVRELNGGDLELRQAKTLKPLLTDEVLTSRAKQYWSFLVGTWAGSQVPIGEKQETDATDAFEFPMVGRGEVDLELEFTVEERISCSSRPADSGSEPECVRITVKSRPDVQKMKEVLQKQVDHFAAQKAQKQGMDRVPDLTVTDVFIRSDMTLVTEPATLRPHRWTDKKTVRMSMEGPNGREKSYKLVDKTQTVFSAPDSEGSG